MSRYFLLPLLAAALLATAASAAPESNPELAAIKAEDQADSQPGPNKIDWAVVNQRDEQRRTRVLQIPEGRERQDRR